MGGLRVVDGSAELLVAVWVSESRVFAVVAVEPTIAFVALTLDLFN